MTVSAARVVSGKTGEPVSLGKVMRGATLWLPRHAFVAHFCRDNDRALKTRLQPADEDVASDAEYAALKELGAVNKHMAASKCLLVQARPAAAAAKKFLPQAATRWVDLALARLLWDGIAPIPSTLPSSRGGEDSDGEDSDDEDTRDDEDFDRSVEPERIYGISDFAGVVGWQLEGFERFVTSPVHLDRAAGDIRLQSSTSWANMKSVVSRYLGWASADSSARAVRDAGLLLLLDGPMVMRFVAFLLTVRGNELTTLVTTLHALTKGVAFVLSTLEGDPGAPPAEREAYIRRLRMLAAQFQHWSAAAPRYRPTYAELCESGRFVPLPDVLSKTVPYLRAAAARPVDSLAAALAARDAAVLACVAGDGFPNIRPRELLYLRDAALEPPAGALKACLFSGCVFPGCKGDFLKAEEDGGMRLYVTHHKTVAQSGPRSFVAPAGTAANEALKALLQAGAALRANSGCRGLVLSKDGTFLTASALASIASKQLAAAGLKGQSARSVRRSCVVAGSDALDAEEQSGMARIMGNSQRAWRNAYDVKRSHREELAGHRAYQSLVATAGAPAPSAPPRQDASGAEASAEEDASGGEAGDEAGSEKEAEYLALFSGSPPQPPRGEARDMTADEFVAAHAPQDDGDAGGDAGADADADGAGAGAGDGSWHEEVPPPPCVTRRSPLLDGMLQERRARGGGGGGGGAVAAVARRREAAGAATGALAGAKRRSPLLDDMLEEGRQRAAARPRVAEAGAEASPAGWQGFVARSRGRPCEWAIRPEALDVAPLTEEEFYALSKPQRVRLFLSIFTKPGLAPGETPAPPISGNTKWYYNKLVRRLA